MIRRRARTGSPPNSLSDLKPCSPSRFTEFFSKWLSEAGRKSPPERASSRCCTKRETRARYAITAQSLYCR